jgi:hypothetical protein
MDYFSRLGELVDDLYREQDHRETGFPDVVARAFTELPPVDHVRPYDALHWLCTTHRMPEQRSIEHAFSDPITMYVGRGFTVELLFWLDNTATIHQHPWCGGYHVLAGSSVHSEYGFEVTEHVNSRIAIGKVIWRRTEWLGTGQTKLVLLGSDFIHTAFHIENPSVSVIVKSSVVPGAEPGYDYLPPSLRINPYFKPALLKRQLQALDLVRRVNPEAFVPRLSELVADSDFHATCLLLIENLPHLDDEQLARILEHARRHHGARVEILLPVFAEFVRYSEFAATRLHVHDGAHRGLLGLLMQAPDRATLLQLVRTRVPGRDPVDVVMDWLRGLAAGTDGAGDVGPLGLHLGDTELTVLEGIVRGLTPGAQRARLTEIYGAAEVDRQARALDLVTDTLTHWPMLRALVGAQPW